MTGRTGLKKITVLLVDDHSLVRQGVVLMLQQVPDIQVVGEARDGWGAIEEVERLRPDIVLMDIDMPGLSGIEATRRIVRSNPETGVIMLTVHEREHLLSQSLDAGARGYVAKTADIDHLVSAVRTVRAGEVFIDPPMATRLVGDYLRRLRGGGSDDLYDRLSTREREVLPMLAEGSPASEIAKALHVSPHTVQIYRQRDNCRNWIFTAPRSSCCSR